MKKYLIAAALAALIPAANARADWNGTTWGMSPTEVANNSTVPLREEDAQDSVLWQGEKRVFSYKVNDLDFRGAFIFHDGKLEDISLKLKLSDFGDCDKLADMLKLRYGSATLDYSQKDGSFKRHWDDPEHHNRIILQFSTYDYNMEPDCYLDYQPFFVPKPGQL